MAQAQRSHLPFQPLRRYPQAGNTRVCPDVQWVPLSEGPIPKSNGRIATSRGFCTELRGDLACPCARGGRRTHENILMVTRSLVSVVDDDESVRESLPDMLRQ